MPHFHAEAESSIPALVRRIHERAVSTPLTANQSDALKDAVTGVSHNFLKPLVEIDAQQTALKLLSAMAARLCWVQNPALLGFSSTAALILMEQRQGLSCT